MVYNIMRNDGWTRYDMTYADNMPKADQEKYAGQWVIIIDSKVVWHSKTGRGIEKAADKYQKQKIIPIIFRVSDGSNWLL